MDLSYQIKPDDDYGTVKQVLKEEFFLSDRLILKLKNSQKIDLNGKITYVNCKVKIFDIIHVKIDFKEDNSNIIAKNLPLTILYEDDYYLVVAKPASMPVHPSMLHFEDSLSNGIKAYFDSIGLAKKVRPVNRLDKDTSGIVVFAKNEYIQECLIRQMKQNLFKKEYIAIVDGFFEKKKRDN
jgi:pseudouridylate synthase